MSTETYPQNGWLEPVAQGRGRSFALGCELSLANRMRRHPRICPSRTCFHAINRAVARLNLLGKAEDYEAFGRNKGGRRNNGVNETTGPGLLDELGEADSR